MSIEVLTKDNAREKCTERGDKQNRNYVDGLKRQLHYALDFLGFRFCEGEG